MQHRLDNQMSLDLGGRGDTAERIDLPDADIVLYRGLFSRDESDRLFDTLLRETHWKQDRATFYGRPLDVPRLTAWHGDPGKSYAYSGITVEPEAWTSTLLEIKQRVESVSGNSFNSVLLNRYRNGRDSVSWHTDDEPELGTNPVIASVSFGATRSFHLRHRASPGLRAKIELSHGSCLLMRGPTQHYWLHQVPKVSRPVGERVNLTFRVIR